MALTWLPSVKPSGVVGLVVGCLCLLSSAGADASCGDWLQGHADMASAEKSLADNPADGIGEARQVPGVPMPSRPCNGPACRKAPQFPLIPTDAPATSLELERDAVLRSRAGDLSFHPHAILVVDDPFFLSASANPLERPPRVI